MSIFLFFTCANRLVIGFHYKYGEDPKLLYADYLAKSRRSSPFLDSGCGLAYAAPTGVRALGEGGSGVIVVPGRRAGAHEVGEGT